MNRNTLTLIGGRLLTLALLFGAASGLFSVAEARPSSAAAAGGAAQYGRRDRDDNELYRTARSNGQRAGFNQGDSDGKLRRPYNPRGGRIYRDGKAGYYKELGDKDDYKRAYQDAFVRGYDEGFYRYDNNGGYDRDDDDRRRRRRRDRDRD